MESSEGNKVVTPDHLKNNKVRAWRRLARGINRKRLNSKRFAIQKATLLENVYQFTQNTTLHALKFTGDKNISRFERLFFLAAFVISLSLATNFIYNIYSKWSSTPVIIANSASTTFISQIPFPAITICNMNQALKSKVAALDRQSPSFSVLQALCYRQLEEKNRSVATKWGDFENFLVKSTQPCAAMLVACKYASIPFKCTDLFKPVLTDEGRCCTFNTVDIAFMYKTTGSQKEETRPKDYLAVDWTPEVGYPRGLPRDFYPTVASGTGYSMGLTLILNADVDEYYCSSTNGAGFKILLHSPIETPNVGDIGFSMQVGYETRTVITPILSDASDTIRGMRKDVRQCLFFNEANLTYYRGYTRRNCEMECEARLVAEECKCILYYMPRINQDIPICNSADSACHQSINLRVQAANQDQNNCSKECIPACFDLTYQVQTYDSPISQGSFHIKEHILENMTTGFAEKNIAVAHFYYIENAFRSRTKEQFVGFTEFLSSIGGLMGLFIGFSVISVVELIYYSSLRPYYAKRRYDSQFRRTKRFGEFLGKFLPTLRASRLLKANEKFNSSTENGVLFSRSTRRLQQSGGYDRKYANSDYTN